MTESEEKTKQIPIKKIDRVSADFNGSTKCNQVNVTTQTNSADGRTLPHHSPHI
jgi:hypothetical protein